MKPTEALMHPAGWSTANVGKAIELRRGVSWAKDQEFDTAHTDRVTVLRISNVQGRLETDDLLYLSGIPEAVRKKKRVTKGWSILVGSNGNRKRIGNAVFVAEDSEYLFASFLVAAKPREASGIDPAFFFRWLNTEAVQYRLTSTAEGSTGLSNLSQDFLKAMEIAFPGPDEQVGIACILDAADSAIERARVAVEKAGVLGRNLRETLVVGGDWPLESLGRYLGEGPTNGVYRPESDYGTEGTPIIRIDSFGVGTIRNIAGLRRVRLPSVLRDRYATGEGDILINRVNSLDFIGKAALVPRMPETTIFESNMMRLRLRDPLRADYLIEVLLSSVAKRHWLMRAKAAVNQASINQRDVASLRIPVPSPEKQKEIATIMAQQRRVFEALSTRLVAIEDLKRGLMQDLLTGRVRVKTTGPAFAAAV